MQDGNTKGNSILKQQANWENLYFYQKSDVVYQLTFAFCNRFIHPYKDRTRDQMIQAARSCKQNIVEGLADGVTSSEMQLKLLNVARASLKELKEDFEDYLKAHHLQRYDAQHSEYDAMLQYCRFHNILSDYEPFFQKWSAEQMCNYAVTLCHMIDKMMFTYMDKLEQEFITEGGIKERMYKARTGFRNSQDERLKQLEKENQQLKAECQLWKEKYEELKLRALAAFNKQQEEIKILQKQLNNIK